MNRLILRYGYPITGVILLIFAWVVYQRIARGSDIITLAVTAGIVWVIGAPAFIWFWPRITVGGVVPTRPNHSSPSIREAAMS